jgi:hypothetical protein
MKANGHKPTGSNRSLVVHWVDDSIGLDSVVVLDVVVVEDSILVVVMVEDSSLVVVVEDMTAVLPALDMD